MIRIPTSRLNGKKTSLRSLPEIPQLADAINSAAYEMNTDITAKPDIVKLGYNFFDSPIQCVKLTYGSTPLSRRSCVYVLCEYNTVTEYSCFNISSLLKKLFSLPIIGAFDSDKRLLKKISDSEKTYLDKKMSVFELAIRGILNI